MGGCVFPVMDLLRGRRALPPDEAVDLLQELPALLDAEIPGYADVPLPGRLSVRFASNIAATKLLEIQRLPVSQWPTFELHLSNSTSETGSDDEEQTVGIRTIAHPVSHQIPDSVREFAALLYELLGGRHRDELGAVCYSPLPALNEQSNAVLQRAFSPRAFPTCVAFWNQWLHSLEPTAIHSISTVLPHPTSPTPHQAVGFNIPRSMLNYAHPGEVLKLTPRQLKQAPIQLVARSKFKIGRSRSQSDFPVRKELPNGDLDEKAKQISRVHVLAECSFEKIELRDGNGSKPSTNGSAFNGIPLDANRPLRMDVDRGVLSLGNLFHVELTTFPPQRTSALQINNLDQWHGPPFSPARAMTNSAILFVPLNGLPLVRNTVWLFNAIGFTLSTDGEVLWNWDISASDAFFVYERGCFWCANRNATRRFDVDSISVAPGEIVPLVSGQTMTLENFQFSVEVT